ncbi:hypothetical protein GCM10009767_00790 [Kocuria aegyptia]|uniref:Uncharacterized protein n=1 Tax=Kocuria aegyptia TaxID=330943 RepID=A0ABN2K2X8_9MICC
MAPLLDGQEDAGDRAACARAPAPPSLAGPCFGPVSLAGARGQLGLTGARRTCEAASGPVRR